MVTFFRRYSNSSDLDRELKVNFVVLKSIGFSMRRMRTKSEYELKVSFQDKIKTNFVNSFKI